MVLSQMTFGNCLGNCFEDSDDLGWLGLFPTLWALIANLVAFKNPNITARGFLWGHREQATNLRHEIMKCRWPTVLESAMRSLDILKDQK